MNKSDSERIATVLERKGYLPARNIKQASFVVVNMCSVRQSAVDRVYNKIKNLKDKQIIITGCILKQDRTKLKKNKCEIIDFKDLFKIEPKIIYPECFVPIMEGCNNFCAYCVVPYTRGREQYRKEAEIINEATTLIKKGCPKITLLGQNVNSYPNFSTLLTKINNLPGNFKITFLTSHPKDFSAQLIDVMAKSTKIIKHLNLPVQSGDDDILKRMNRPYTVQQYKNLVARIRKKIPDIRLSTDIIVGFPGETKKQFERTVKLFKEIKFNAAYISKYSPRPGTAAFKMKDNVPLEEKKRRTKCLRNLLSS